MCAATRVGGRYCSGLCLLRVAGRGCFLFPGSSLLPPIVVRPGHTRGGRGPPLAMPERAKRPGTGSASGGGVCARLRRVAPGAGAAPRHQPGGSLCSSRGHGGGDEGDPESDRPCSSSSPPQPQFPHLGNEGENLPSSFPPSASPEKAPGLASAGG